MDPHSALNSLKVDELKQICKERGLGTGGRKSDLIERLVNFRASLSGSSGRAAPQPAQAATAGASKSPKSPAAAKAKSGGSKAGAKKSTGGELQNGHSHTNGRGGGGAGGNRGGRSGGKGGGKGSAAQAHAAAAAGAAQATNGASAAGDLGAAGAGVCAGGDRGPTSAAAAGNGASTAGGSAASNGELERVLKCSKCGARCEMPEQAQQVRPKHFWCPYCRFKEMDPFNAVVEGVGHLHTARIAADGRLDFTLDLPSLRQWRREGLNVHARMVNISSCKLCHSWPLSLSFRSNGLEVFMVEPPEEGHKRRDVPQDVSSGLRNGRNVISVHVSDDRPCDFCLGILLTTPRGLPELQAQVRTAEVKAAKARVKSLLAKKRTVGEEVACLAPDTVKLVCPVTMERLKMPVRGEECQHLRCFGLEAYLMINQQMRAFNNRWVCPVCTLVLRPPDLVVDSYVMQIMAGCPEDVEEVVLAPDGSWNAPASSSSSARKRPHSSGGAGAAGGSAAKAAKAAAAAAASALPVATAQPMVPPPVPIANAVRVDDEDWPSGIIPAIAPFGGIGAAGGRRR